LLDAVYEAAKGKAKIGSTLKGIGPAYTDKYARNGIRIGDIDSSNFSAKYNDLKQKHFKAIQMYDFDIDSQRFDDLDFKSYEEAWFEGVEKLRNLQHINSEYFINQALDNGKKVLAEGAQGTMLDIDFGSYPYVTSSNTVTAGVCSGLGVSPRRVGEIFGVFKAYCTRVGGGPFPTELSGPAGDKLRSEGHEYGSTTGRPRRCGWLDLTALKYSIMLNGVSALFMMKTDVLSSFDELHIGTQYIIEDELSIEVPFDFLDVDIEPVFTRMQGWKQDITGITDAAKMPGELNSYIKFIEENTNIPVKIVSVGPDRSQTIMR
jgi:adenylosuccinate synthase